MERYSNITLIPQSIYLNYPNKYSAELRLIKEYNETTEINYKKSYYLWAIDCRHLYIS